MTTEQFYLDMESVDERPSILFREPQRFQPVPDDWTVIVTDVKGSTALVEQGQHRIINLVATGCIIAALNIAHRRGIDLPFFFGGDGATVVVPGSLSEMILEALTAHQHNAREQFDIHLRVGAVPVATIYRDGGELRLAKLHRAAAFAIPVIAGDGLHRAEAVVKGNQNENENTDATHETAPLDLTGMECRWNRVAPPPNTEEVVCLLVNIADTANHYHITSAVLEAIESSYGTRTQRNPISTQGLHLTSSVTRIADESRVKLGGVDWRYVLEHWWRTAILGPAFFRFAKDGRRYVETMPALSDTLVLDGRVNTVMSGTIAQRQALIAKLDDFEHQGAIRYGIYCTSASIMSCYVRNRGDAHIHFVDGADGGYTSAAIMLKKKLSGR